MKKIGLLGGTFNPPHFGHLLIANEVKNALQLDEIHFMPAAQSPFKAKETRVTDAHRVAMVELLTEELPASKVETFEIERGGVSYTFDTLQELVSRNPGTHYSFIIGADQVEKLADWYKIDQLVKLVELIGVPRPGYSLETNYPINVLSIPQLEVSSTELRERLALGETTRFLLPEKVAAYCERNELYAN
ncbi:nicotinate-nucleotide adenylyltransferase [Chryseomicrobium sp. FSL W7-1435]|uniref:nicotinate-nucleotide adenylyltransferase n=1 Tax=Chryseomicrobium sp. FSL W7-1435 TaxID=2921704 RepID=UPI00315A87F8